MDLGEKALADDTSAPIEGDQLGGPDEQVVLIELYDGKVRVPKKLIIFFGVIRDLLEDLGIDKEKAIPIAMIPSKVFTDLMDGASRLFSNKTPSQFFPRDAGPDPPRDFMHRELELWEIAYVTGDVITTDLPWVDYEKHIDWERMTALMLASHQLEFKYLNLLIAKVMANRFRGRTAEEILDILEVDSKFTPEEEEGVRREHPWIEKPYDFGQGPVRDFGPWVEKP